MRFRIPAFYDKVMDRLARAILPPPVKIIGPLDATTLVLAIYFILGAAALIWWTGNWMWGLAVLLGVAMAYIMMEWMF